MNWETYAIFAATTLEVCLTPGRLHCCRWE